MPTVRGRKSGGGSPPKKKSSEYGVKKAATARPLKTKAKAPAKKAAAKAAPSRKPAPGKGAKAKPASSSRTAARKPAARPSVVRKLVRKAASATKSVAKKASSAGRKVAKPVRKAGKAAASRPLKAVKQAALKTSGRSAGRSAPVSKPAKPVKPAKKASKAAVPSPKPAKPAKSQEKKTPAPVAQPRGKKTAPAETAAAPEAPRTARAADKKPSPAKAPRRARARVSSSDGPVATWLTPENRPRPSSFIPAPPRAESPSLVAAPPASSDRLIHPVHLEEPEPGIRLYPVRVDIEQGGGRIYVVTNPEQLSIHLGEGVEWDFRYLGGADAIVEEITIEFEKPGPFAKTAFKSQKPGSARPHRQLSGPVVPAAAGKHFQYTIRCIDIFKRVIGTGRPYLVVV